MSSLRPGTRVRILAGSEYPQGATGTIAEGMKIRPAPGAPPLAEWQDGARTVDTTRGPRTYYFVSFDTPQDDGSGDGPYKAGEVEESHLAPIAE